MQRNFHLAPCVCTALLLSLVASLIGCGGVEHLGERTSRSYRTVFAHRASDDDPELAPMEAEMGTSAAQRMLVIDSKQNGVKRGDEQQLLPVVTVPNSEAMDE